MNQSIASSRSNAFCCSGCLAMLTGRRFLVCFVVCSQFDCDIASLSRSPLGQCRARVSPEALMTLAGSATPLEGAPNTAIRNPIHSAGPLACLHHLWIYDRRSRIFHASPGIFSMVRLIERQGDLHHAVSDQSVGRRHGNLQLAGDRLQRPTLDAIEFDGQARIGRQAVQGL